MKQYSSSAWKLSFAVVLGLGLSWIASPARACSLLPRVIESSYPAPGATGVPTNVVLYAAGSQLEADGFALESDLGMRVPTTVSHVLPTGFDITPAIELEPNQRYVLRHPGFSLLAAGPVNTSVEFETGSGPAARALLAPPELTGAALLDGVASPCPNQRLCLEPAGSDSTLFAADSFNNLSERSPGTLTGAYGNALLPGGCVQVWRRDALGDRSDVVDLCASDVTRVELSGDAASTTCEEYRRPPVDIDEPGDPSCTLAVVGAPRSPGPLSGALGLLVMLGASCRRRSSGLKPRALSAQG